MEYNEVVDSDETMIPDDNGNSPLIYLAGSYKVEQFSYHILRSSLPKRRLLVHNQNAANTSCREIAERNTCSQKELKEFFLRSVLNNKNESNLHSFYSNMIDTWQWLLIRLTMKLNYDPRLRFIIYYSLNEYPIPLSETEPHLLIEHGQMRRIKDQVGYKEGLNPH